ncbi:hypothetical protein K8I28_13075 [bacterium]|nr:hypothetical protein [bacterium]
MRLTRKYEIHSSLVGQDHLLSLAKLADLLQECAVFHADSLQLGAKELLANNLAWVLSRMRFKIYQMPKIGESITIETFPTGLEKFFADRGYSVRNEAGSPLVDVTTRWVTLNVERRRPQLPPDFISNKLREVPAAVLNFESKKLPALERVDGSREFRVRMEDLDFNGHVNNTHYIAWALETLPVEHQNTHPLADFDIVFRSESVYGATIVCNCQVDQIDKNKIIARYEFKDSQSEKVVVSARSECNLQF